MSKEELNFSILPVKANCLKENDSILLKKGLGIQEYRVVTLDLENGLVTLKLRDLYSLDYLDIKFNYDDTCHLVAVSQERKIVTEKQLLYRGHH